MDEFAKIVPSAFGPFIGHHQGLLACIKSAHGVMVIIAGYGHGDMSSNPGPD